MFLKNQLRAIGDVGVFNAGRPPKWLVDNNNNYLESTTAALSITHAKMASMILAALERGEEEQGLHSWGDFT